MGLFFVNNDEGQVFFMSTRYPRTDEQRQRHNEYQRQYRQANPDRVKRWRERYLLRAAERLMANGGQGEGGEANAGH